MNYNGFFDLNIQPQDDEIWKNLYNYNVRTVAVNQHLDTTVFDDTKKKKSEKREDIVPSPEKLMVPEEYKEKFVVIKRLTVSLSDGSLLHKIVQSPNFKQYDIIAVAPTNHQALQICCASNDIDMICFEPQNKPQWNITRKVYNIAIQKNIFFELQYSQVISDSTSRRNTIQIAHTYHTMGKSRNIVVSSGTSNAKLLRSPYDVINFCFLFGFKEKEAKKTLTSNAKQVLLRAAYRRHKRTILNIKLVNMNDVESPILEKSESITMDVE